MENSMKRLRRENMRSVYLYVSDREGASRAEISGAVGISLMTVGSVIDDLRAQGLVREEKAAGGTPGRRASAVYLSDDSFSIVIDLCRKAPSLYCVSQNGRINDRTNYSYDESADYGTNLSRFLETAADRIFMRMNFTYCIGVGAVVPGGCDRNGLALGGDFGLCGLPVAKTVADCTGIGGCFVMSESRCRAVSSVRAAAPRAGGKTVYIFSGDSFDLVPFSDGIPLTKPGFERGALLSSFSDDLRQAGSDSGRADIISRAVSACELVIAPDLYVAGGEHLAAGSPCLDMLKARFPDSVFITESNESPAVCGMGLLLRSIFAEKM